jgi:hypothetical protein
LGIHLFSPVNSFFFRKLRFNSNLTPLSSIQSFSPFGKKAEQFDHELAAAETVAVLERQKRLLKAILSVYGLQFKELWKRWCRQREVEAFFACPSHHEDKGKVERCIRSLNREFINPLRKFPGLLKGKLGECRDWFNNSRFHRGIKAVPANLCKCNVEKLI